MPAITVSIYDYERNIADSKRWRELDEAFRAIDSEGVMSVRWRCPNDAHEPGGWQIIGGTYRQQLLFEDCARTAGHELRPGLLYADTLTFWLVNVRNANPDFALTEYTDGTGQARSGTATGPASGGLQGTIRDICNASANLCLSIAVEQADNERFEIRHAEFLARPGPEGTWPEPQPVTPEEPALAPVSEMTLHERRIAKLEAHIKKVKANGEGGFATRAAFLRSLRGVRVREQSYSQWKNRTGVSPGHARAIEQGIDNLPD